MIAAEQVRHLWAPEFLVALMQFLPGSVEIKVEVKEGPEQGSYKVTDWQPAYGDGGRGYFVCERVEQ